MVTLKSGLSAEGVIGSETAGSERVCGKEQEAVSADHLFEKFGWERKEENA